MKRLIRPGDWVKLTPTAAKHWRKEEPFVIMEMVGADYAGGGCAWFRDSDLIFIRRATDKEYLAALLQWNKDTR